MRMNDVNELGVPVVGLEPVLCYQYQRHIDYTSHPSRLKPMVYYLFDNVNAWTDRMPKALGENK